MARATNGMRLALSPGGRRYVGTLYTVDAAEAAVALQNVREFGTESRRTGAAFVPPSNNIVDFVIFRGSDIEDLTVIEDEQPAQAAAPANSDPAIIPLSQSSITPPPPSNNNNNNNNRAGNNPPAHQPLPTPAGNPWNNGPPGGHHHQSNNNHHNQNNNQRGGYRGRGGRGRGSYARPAGPVGSGKFFVTGDGKTSGTAIPDKEFDLTGKTLDMEAIKTELETAAENPPVVPAKTYSKSDDFFDEISCDALDKQARLAAGDDIDVRALRAKQRELDTDTFGMSRARPRGGYRGRGRGGYRGRGRGGYRGGFQNYNYNNNNNNNNNNNANASAPASN